MRQLVSTPVAALVLVLLSTNLSLVSDAHRGPFKCIHDTAEIQRLEHSGMDKIAPQPGGAGKYAKEDEQRARARRERGGAVADVDSTPQKRRMEEQAIGGLRVVVSSLDVSDDTKYCTRTGQTVPTFTGSTTTCQAHDILTDEKRGWLLNNIIPAALAVIKQKMSVDQLTSALQVPSGACSHFSIPTSHTTTGVSNADFVLYVATGPASEGNLAWAATCARDSNRRPVVGRANFNPRYINWTTSVLSVNQEQVATAVHELLHALGFSGGNFVSTTKVQMRGKEVTLVNSPQVLKVTREYFGCATAEGAEVEDEGGSGSAGSHWDRRVLKDEMMAAAGGDIFSVFTLAHLKDTGWYTINLGNSETIEWGQDAGCGFLQSKCNVAEGGRDKYFCFDNSGDICTYKRDAIGYCPISTYTADLPTKFQWFSNPRQGGQEFYDYCPVPTGYSNRICGNTKTLTDNEKSFGHYFGAGGKCFETDGLLKDGLQAANMPTLRCLQSRCTDGGTKVQFQVDSSGWIDCPASAGSKVSAPSGWQGNIICPAATDICSDGNTFTSAPPTPEPPSPPITPIPGGVTPAPTVSDPLPIVEGTITISGAQTTWSQLLASGTGTSNTELALKNALKQDIGSRLSIDPVHIELKNLRLGSLEFEYFLYNIDSHTRAQVQNIWTEEENGSQWLFNTRGVFRTTGENETIYLVRGTATDSEAQDNWCGNGYTNDECTYIMTIAGAGLLIILIVLCIVCCCCCRQPSPEDHAEAGRLNRKQQYESRQQAQYGATSGGGGRRRGNPY